MIAETHYAKLPLVAKGEYLSLIKESDLLDAEYDTMELRQLQLPAYCPSCILTAHPFDAVKAAIQFNLPVVPLLDEKQKYVGSVSRASLFNYLGENGGLSQPGGIIVLEMHPRDYVLSQIAKIAENEDVKILNSRVYLNPQTEMLEVTLKMSKVELARVLAALERYDYLVKEVYGDLPTQDDLDDRYKLLMNYLNI
jgi:acetoin utilization protein AcuB